jgi:hypothetical protein
MPSAVAAITGLVNMEEPILLDGAIFPNKKPKKFHLLQTSFSLPENFIPMVDDNVVNVVKKFLQYQEEKRLGSVKLQVTSEDTKMLTINNGDTVAKWYAQKKKSRKE